MRRLFSDLMEEMARQDEGIVFVTGDLGYNALENLQALMGPRFINAGVAEQNMVSLAAGLAYKGYQVFCYSIAPFMVYRAVEQIRLDVCLHKLPVYFVGNGGGYGYGIMGSTHHAIEDIACLSPLPHLSCFVPAFKRDVRFCLEAMLAEEKPAYLRLGAAVADPSVADSVSDMVSVRHSAAPKLTVVALGPAVKNAIEAITGYDDVDIFTARRIPLRELGHAFSKSIGRTGKLLVVEEHVLRGGLSEHLATRLLTDGVSLKRFKSAVAHGYPTGLQGSQNYHQKVNGLDVLSIATLIRDMRSN